MYKSIENKDGVITYVDKELLSINKLKQKMEQLSLKNLTKSSTTRHIKSSMTNSPKIKRRHSSPALVAPTATTPVTPAALAVATSPVALAVATSPVALAVATSPVALAATSPVAAAATLQVAATSQVAATKLALPASPSATLPATLPAAPVAAPAAATSPVVAAKPVLSATLPATSPAPPSAVVAKPTVTQQLQATFERAKTHAPLQKILMSDDEIKTYVNTMKRANTIHLNKDDLKTAINFANLFIDHARDRIQQLREKLTNPDTLVIIPGNNDNNEHYLGKGLAIHQWGKTDINIYAWKLFIDDLTNELNKLQREFPFQVIYDTFDRKRADNNNIIVWGANSHNVEGEDNHYIDGGGQAAYIGTYGNGIFGIITTPTTGLPIDRERQLEISKKNHLKILKEKQKYEWSENVSHKYLTYKNNFNQSKYYEKYLKYKLKYNQLKEKLNKY
jgi:hypothetical protein